MSVTAVHSLYGPSDREAVKFGYPLQNTRFVKSDGSAFPEIGDFGIIRAAGRAAKCKKTGSMPGSGRVKPLTYLRSSVNGHFAQLAVTGPFWCLWPE